MAFSLSDYKILDEIGHGGFGTILKASQKSLGRTVIIKLLSPKKTQHQKEILRFRHEAQAMAMLSHDNIIAVFDYAYFGDNYYIVMEYIDGIDFDQALKTGVPLHVSLYIMDKVISGLLVAHAEKIIHRDIKPANVLLGKKGQVKLADFGLATFQPDVTKFSSSAAVLGTFCYMAPEAMVTPREVDARVDIFSIGCILYRIVSGDLPFPGTTLGEVSYKVLNREPAPLTIDKNLERLGDCTLKSLCKNRDERPGLEQIHAAVREALADTYQRAQEDLKEYICRKQPKTPGLKEGLQQHENPARSKSLFPALMTAGSAVLLVIVILAAYRIISDRTSGKPTLPRLTVVSDSLSLRSVRNTPASGEIKKIADEAPKPLSSNSIEHTAGTLIIQGVSSGDSVFINGKHISGKIRKQRQQLQLEPGHYTVAVRSGTKDAVTREVRVMPYQVFILDLEKERTSNDRDGRK